jgi:hypothetical protein
MRVLLVGVLVFGLVLSGCARKKAAAPHPASAPHGSAAATKKSPAAAVSKAAWAGEVARVDPVARFVVLSFPLDQMPATDQRLNVYRHGAKVAEVKVTGPQRERNIVADILNGAPGAGDEVRAD